VGFFECFIFNDELELLEARLRETDGVVDRWVLVEAAVTFTGAPKPRHYAENKDRFSPWNDRIEHIVADLSRVPDAWARERKQRDAVHQFIDQLSGDDIVALTDGDELLSRTFWTLIEEPVQHGTLVLPMQQHYFTLTWSTPVGPPPDGGLMERSRVARRRHITTTASEWADALYGMKFHHSGWHLSCLGGPERLLSKLRSFSHTELSDPRWANLENCTRMIRDGIDIDPVRKWPLHRVPPQGPQWLITEGVERWPWLIDGVV
jgi:hypothetical protein